MTDKREFKMRPRARLMSILGEQLVSDQAVGLIELVKNSYDADATEVILSLENTYLPDNTVVTVLDNGTGMSLEDIESRWLSPAIDFKQRQKDRRERSKRGRLPIGEKGVGRFAVQQLGTRLELVTRQEGRPEIIVNIDWNEFDNGDTFLDSVEIPVQEREPVIFPGTKTGTRLTILHARSRWTEALIRKVQRALRRLQSPRTGPSEFRIKFICPDFIQYENLDTSDITDHAHYSFVAAIDDQGQADYEYSSSHPACASRTFAEDGRNLTIAARDELEEMVPKCGPFYINLYVWDRRQEYLSASGVSRADLDAHSGISIFRDGLRILPYGEAGDDWLNLDRDRINDPSKRLSNNQVIGFVEINQTTNPELRDKTNREGLIDNQAFRDLRSLTRAALSVFTLLWMNDRPKDTTGRVNADPVATVGAVKTVAGALASSAREDVIVNIPVKSAQTAIPDAPQEPEKNRGESYEKPVLHSRQVTQREAAQELVKGIDEIEKDQKQQNTTTQRQMEILHDLAATGMAARRVVHEFGRQVATALDALPYLRRLAGASTEAAKAVETLDICLGTLRNEFRVLAPYESVTRPERTTEKNVLEAAALAVLLNQETANERNIELSCGGTGFIVRTRPASLVQCLDNLVNNACFWVSGNAPGLPRRIHIEADAFNRIITVSDTGPGVPDHLKESIFEPFVTTRNHPQGEGLGLYITRELLKSMKASISVEDNSTENKLQPSGARFVIRFQNMAVAE